MTTDTERELFGIVDTLKAELKKLKDVIKIDKIEKFIIITLDKSLYTSASYMEFVTHQRTCLEGLEDDDLTFIHTLIQEIGKNDLMINVSGQIQSLTGIYFDIDRRLVLNYD